MASRRATDLAYGHLGEASYSAAEKKWAFSQDRSSYFHVEQIQKLEHCLPGHQTKEETKASARLRRAQEKWLRKSYPDTAAIDDNAMLRSDVVEDPAIIVAHGISPSSIMSVGELSLEDGSQHDQQGILIAQAAGESGNVLELIRPGFKDLAWDGHTNPSLEVTDLSSIDVGYWNGHPSPIQQIQFAQREKTPGSRLAVRQLSQTLIFDPILEDKLVYPESHPLAIDDYPASYINANRVATIDIDETGGALHVDLSFNPWDTNEISILDARGHWSLWALPQEGNGQAPGRLVKRFDGSLFDKVLGDARKESEFVSEWGRIVWVGQSTTLAICNRAYMIILDTRHPLDTIHVPQILKDPEGWILDVKRSPVDPSHLFVLTTVDILWVDVAGKARGDTRLNVRILLSCRHYRRQDNLSLSLELTRDDEACVAFVTSRHTSLAHAYRFEFAQHSPEKPTCAMASFVLRTVLKDEESSMRPSIRKISILPSYFSTDDASPINGPGREYLGRRVKFYELLVLGEDLSLSQTLITSYLTTEGTQITSQISPPTRSTIRGRISRPIPLFDCQFVVPDSTAKDEIARRDPRTVREASSTPAPVAVEDKGVLRSATINMSPIFQRIFRQPRSEDQLSITDFVGMLETGVEGLVEIGNPMLMTLWNLVDSTCFGGDVDEAAAAAMDMISGLQTTNDEDELQVTITPLALPVLALESQDEHPSSISAFYDNLISTLVGSLPLNTSGPTRLSKERLVRQVATELFLGSMTLSIENTTSAASAVESAPVVSFQLPIRGGTGVVSRSSSHPTESLAADADTTAMPRSSISQIPSSVAQPGHLNPENVAFHKLEAVESAAVARLRALSPTIKSQPPLSTSKSSILAHWPCTPGGDPAMYSWSAVRHAIAMQQQGADDTPAGRREARRRRRRAEKAAREEETPSRWASQPVPKSSYASQPERMPPMAQSSSQVMDDVPMSQPVLGAFGTRSSKQVKKKKRKAAGFR